MESHISVCICWQLGSFNMEVCISVYILCSTKELHDEQEEEQHGADLRLRQQQKPQTHKITEFAHL